IRRGHVVAAGGQHAPEHHRDCHAGHNDRDEDQDDEPDVVGREERADAEHQNRHGGQRETYEARLSGRPARRLAHAATVRSAMPAAPSPGGEPWAPPLTPRAGTLRRVISTDARWLPRPEAHPIRM